MVSISILGFELASVSNDKTTSCFFSKELLSPLVSQKFTSLTVAGGCSGAGGLGELPVDLLQLELLITKEKPLIIPVRSTCLINFT